MDKTFFQQKFYIFLYILYIPADNQSFSHVESPISLHIPYIFLLIFNTLSLYTQEMGTEGNHVENFFSTCSLHEYKTLIERGLRSKCRDVEKKVKFRISFGITESRQSGKYKSKVSLTNKQIRQGDFVNSSRRVDQLIKDFSEKLFIFFKKLCQVFQRLFLLFFRFSIEERILRRSAYRNGKHLFASIQDSQSLGRQTSREHHTGVNPMIGSSSTCRTNGDAHIHTHNGTRNTGRSFRTIGVPAMTTIQSMSMFARTYQ